MSQLHYYMYFTITSAAVILTQPTMKQAYSQIIEAGLSPIVVFPPGVTDDVELIGVHQDEIHNGVHDQTPPDWDSEAVPEATGHLVCVCVCVCGGGGGGGGVCVVGVCVWWGCVCGGGVCVDKCTCTCGGIPFPI